MREKNLTNQERQHVAEFLLENTEGGKIKHTKRIEAAERFNVSIRTISTIWARARQQLAQGLPLDMRTKKIGRQAHNKITIDLAALQALPASSRRTIRGTSAGLHIGKSSVQRAVAAKVIRSHTNSIKPDLSNKHKVDRLKFCLAKIDSTLTFKTMDHVIHIDEKWFYLTRPTVRYLLAPDEPEPHRTCKHKSHIPKLMFLAAVSRPIYGSNGEVLFDGKIGLFPFIKEQEAKKKSKNRPRYNIELKAPTKVDRDAIRNKIIDEVIPAIKQKWPPFLSKNVHIQQDNCKTHIDNADPKFRAAASSDGFNINIVRQPALSPDMNILDLGFFNSIQSLQHETPAGNIEGLLHSVIHAFEREDPATLNKVFLTHQASMIEVIKVLGGNNYKMPHMGKDALMRQGLLPRMLTVEEDVVRAGMEHLISIGDTSNLEVLMHALGLAENH